MERWQSGLLPKLSYERLPLSRGRFAFKAFDPATKLLSHFIEFFRKKDILLIVECTDVPEDLQKEFCDVESHVRFPKIGYLLLFSQIACDEKKLSCLYERPVNLRTKRVAEVLRYVG